MLSFVLGNGLHPLNKHLKPPEAEQPFTKLDTGYEGLEVSLPAQVKFAGAIGADGENQFSE